MKELTIEQKAKRYDEAIKKLKILHDNWATTQNRAAKEVEEVFPELNESKESKDERIRKGIKSILEHYKESGEVVCPYLFVSINEALAWLEKQSKTFTKKDADDAYQIRKDIATFIFNYKGDIKDRAKWIDYLGIKVSFVENQSEHKPVNVVEFHEGDWVVYNHDICQIIKREEGCNKLVTVFGIEKELVNERNLSTARLWSIADAKDGDVLACNEEILLFKSYSVQGRISLYCWYNGQTGNFHSKEVTDTLITTRNKICPATKEQCDLLFQKMKEAGYEWDVEKKELKKNESYSLRSIIEDEPSPAIKKVVDSLTAQNKEDEKIKQAHNIETQKSVEWEPQTGDTFRKKGTTSPTYHLCGKRKDGITFGFVENREVGIAGGEITIFALKSDYELVERLKPIEDVVEEELNKALQTKVEQKTAWSEEDERIYRGLHNLIYSTPYCDSRKELSDWLKSLKNRVQPKQESLKSITAHCDYSEYEDWT